MLKLILIFNIYFKNVIFWLTRLLNKKESEDQAHVYVPAARKPKIEEPPRFLGHREINANELAVESPKIVETNPLESMDIEPNSDDIAEKSESMHQKNLDGEFKAKDNNKKPTLSDEDLNNFKNSISYVSKIPSIFNSFHWYCF